MYDLSELRSSNLPLALLLGFFLGLIVLTNGKSVIDQLVMSFEVAALDDPEEARFAVSPWLRTQSETADTVRASLKEDLPVLVSSTTPWFVALLVQPARCYFDRPRVRRRFRDTEWILVTIDESGRGSIEKLSIPEPEPLPVLGFEDGSLSGWTVTLEGSEIGG